MGRRICFKYLNITQWIWMDSNLDGQISQEWMDFHWISNVFSGCFFSMKLILFNKSIVLFVNKIKIKWKFIYYYYYFFINIILNGKKPESTNRKQMVNNTFITWAAWSVGGSAGWLAGWLAGYLTGHWTPISGISSTIHHCPPVKEKEEDMIITE